MYKLGMMDWSSSFQKNDVSSLNYEVELRSKIAVIQVRGF